MTSDRTRSGSVTHGVERVMGQYEAGEEAATSAELLGNLVQESQYVGEVFSLGYETALVQVHDYHRKQVGGIPGLSFLVATRLVPNKEINFREEDSSVILLRVMDAAPLPNDDEATRVRVQSAQQVAGKLDEFWDESRVMDHHTARLLSYAGLRCRVIGTFYIGSTSSGNEPLRLLFGSDLSNYYPNRGLKVSRQLQRKALRTTVQALSHQGLLPGITLPLDFTVGEIQEAVIST